MQHTKTRISFTAEEVFDALYHRNYHLWCEVVDFVADHAQQCFERKIQGAEEVESPVDHGINFDGDHEVIYFEIPS